MAIRGRPRRIYTPEEQAEIVVLYADMGMTRIARRLKGRWRGVKAVLIEHGVELRPHYTRWCHMCRSQIGQQWAALYCDWYEGKCEAPESAEDVRSFEAWRPTMTRRVHDV